MFKKLSRDMEAIKKMPSERLDMKIMRWKMY